MGAAGSGKTTMATIINGLSNEHIFILDKQHGAFSTSMLAGSYCAIAEDTENGRVDVPSHMFHALLGREREDTTCKLNIRIKFEGEKSVAMPPISMVVQCNFPTPIENFEGSKADEVKATALGEGVGMSRRTEVRMAAPPPDHCAAA